MQRARNKMAKLRQQIKQEGAAVTSSFRWTIELGVNEGRVPELSVTFSLTGGS